MLIENDIKMGNNTHSVSRSSQEVLPVVYEKKHRASGIFYEEIVMHYNNLSKMFKDLNDMITDQLS
jgi:hemoglobin-like flavoprotein